MCSLSLPWLSLFDSMVSITNFWTVPALDNFLPGTSLSESLSINSIV